MSSGKTYSVDLEELNFKEFVNQKIKNHLKENPLMTFTITGLMVLIFNRKENDMIGSFKQWKNQEDGALYNIIWNCLDILVKEKRVNCVKQGKKHRGNYWWNI